MHRSRMARMSLMCVQDPDREESEDMIKFLELVVKRLKCRL